MPELPEVQTIVCDLDESIRGFEIVDLCSFWKKNVDKGKFQNFKRKILGRKITGVERRGKYILLLLDSGGAIVVHLRMSGQLIVENQKPRTKIQKKELEDSHVRHFWMLRKGRKKITLSFVDIRKFGTVDLLDDVKNISHKGLLRFGVEPLSKNFSLRCLEEICNKSPKRTIRQILLDQQMICKLCNANHNKSFAQGFAQGSTLGKIEVCREKREVFKKC